MTRIRIIRLAFLSLCFAALTHSAAWAEGSRNLYPNGAQGNRANIEWRTNTYGNLLLRRTLLKVYAQAGEYLLVGSSAVGVGSGDVLIYNPNRVTGAVGSENIPATADFQASSQSGKGLLTTRAQELAGAQAVSGGGNPNGYAPAYYVAPSTGIYSVVFYGPDGSSSAANGTVGADVALTSSNDTSTNQHSSVAAWDVTVRSGAASTTDLTGRLFSSYLALFTGNNGLPLYSTIYAATTDGYQYRIAMNGLDPNGFIVYGNQIGFLDSDGVTPLYHDVLGADGQVSSIQGGCSLALPTYPLFFNTPDNGTLGADGVSTTPITPTISGVGFMGSAGGNNSRVGMGGTFTYTSNLSAVYDIVISRDGVNFDPTLPTNRRLRGARSAGTNTVSWDGRDNSGANFPVGTNYPFRASIHAGEYHFPLLDAENSTLGGPSFTLINGSNPLGNSTGFYDDRGYRTAGGFYVTSDSASGTSGSASKVGQALGGINPPNPAFSDAVNGFSTTGSQRAFGQPGNSGNTNTPNTGSFGDTKGLDIWTYTPSSTASSTLNIQGTPQVLLVKRITAVNGVAVSGYTDDPNTTDDNSAYWPSPASTYLRGALSGTKVQPGDTVEYTIYFVCTGGPATDFTLCDPVPTNMTFQPDTYTGMTPGDGGTAGAPAGIALALNASTLPILPTNYLTNGADGDRGQFYAPGVQAPAAANPPSYSQPLPAASNTTGVVAVAIVSNPTTLPSATGAGTPTGSYGFVRFSTKVN